LITHPAASAGGLKVVERNKIHQRDPSFLTAESTAEGTGRSGIISSYLIPAGLLIYESSGKHINTIETGRRADKGQKTRSRNEIKEKKPQRCARFHFSDDRSFVYITISAMERERASGEKKRISIFPWHSTSTSTSRRGGEQTGGREIGERVRYRRRHCYVREPSLFPPRGENATGNKSDGALPSFPPALPPPAVRRPRVPPPRLDCFPHYFPFSLRRLR
jgi:hypothetical protein